jgi:hypothetical protein
MRSCVFSSGYFPTYVFHYTQTYIHRKQIILYRVSTWTLEQPLRVYDRIRRRVRGSVVRVDSGSHLLSLCMHAYCICIYIYIYIYTHTFLCIYVYVYVHMPDVWLWNVIHACGLLCIYVCTCVCLSVRM